MSEVESLVGTRVSAAHSRGPAGPVVHRSHSSGLEGGKEQVDSLKVGRSWSRMTRDLSATV